MSLFIRITFQLCVFLCSHLVFFHKFSSGLIISGPSRWEDIPSLFGSPSKPEIRRSVAWTAFKEARLKQSRRLYNISVWSTRVKSDAVNPNDDMKTVTRRNRQRLGTNVYSDYQYMLNRKKRSLWKIDDDILFRDSILNTNSNNHNNNNIYNHNNHHSKKNRNRRKKRRQPTVDKRNYKLRSTPKEQEIQRKDKLKTKQTRLIEKPGPKRHSIPSDDTTNTKAANTTNNNTNTNINSAAKLTKIKKKNNNNNKMNKNKNTFKNNANKRRRINSAGGGGISGGVGGNSKNKKNTGYGKLKGKVGNANRGQINRSLPPPSRSSKSDKVCHICKIKREDKERRLKKLKLQILKQVGFTDFPNITKSGKLFRVPIIQQIIDSMSMQRDEPIRTRITNLYSFPEHVIIMAETLKQQQKQLLLQQNKLKSTADNINDIYYFDTGSKLEHSVIKEAKLWLYLKKSAKSNKKSVVRVRIWNATVNTMQDKALKYIKFEASNQGQWIKLKITGVVKYWVKNPEYNYGLKITAVDLLGDNRIWSPSDPGSEEYPVMDITFSRQKYGRQRRTINNKCSASEPVGRCCLYPLTVNFTEEKWDWIIHPKTFEANYCSGNCSYDMMDDAFPNTYLSYHSGNDEIPCCTSTNEGVLQILYRSTENQVIHTHLKNIIVNNCGCR
ncbi:bone morphogenetic protein 5-like [Argonauta hians]